MTRDPLAGCSAKLKRAELHFKSLHTEIGAFLKREPKPYRFVPEIDMEASQALWRLNVVEEPPLEWSTIAGDCMQNLRAALDHLIWVLVKANGFEPTNSNAFPIFDVKPPDKSSNGERMRWNRQVYGLHPSVLRFLDLCQPYQGPDRPSTHALAGLRALSNEDKHRTLLPAFVAVDERKQSKLRGLETRDIKRPDLKRLQVRAGRPLEEHDVVVEMPIEITGPNPEVKLKAELPLDVGIGREPIPLKGLDQMGQSVGRILERSRLFLGE
jgi:hypothetical protein